MSKVKVAAILLAVSLGLLVVYGVDVAIASTSVEPEESGFLPLNASVRGSVFGGSAVIMSIIAFAISTKEYSWAISSLLFVNGGLILIGMIYLIIDAGSVLGTSAIRTTTFTIATGGVLIGLGIWRVILDTRLVEHRKTS